MHDTALLAGALFAKVYTQEGQTVVDIGSMDVNGSLRPFYSHAKYVGVDMCAHTSVDVVVKPHTPLPFETGSVDAVISSSCFEHDPCFWLTFREICRIVKLGGYIYINAPSNGVTHQFPCDCWRFFPDAGQALAYWSSYKMSSETIFPAKVLESFHILPKTCVWKDFVCVWQRTNEIQTDLKVSDIVKTSVGVLETSLREQGMSTVKSDLVTN
jgi:SAM-dependent methyltransferase